MRIAEYQEIIIDWKRSQKIPTDDALALFYKENEDLSATDTLYQIYGDHHLYGTNVLLYIGKTEVETNKRLKQHLNSFFLYANNLSISIGTISNYLLSNEEGGNKLEIPESILIANHKPAFNKEYIHDIDPRGKKSKIIVINNGNHGMLKNSCTNFWWVDNK